MAPSVVSFTHIVSAIDFSESSLAGLRWALSLAEEADAHLSLLHVIEVPPELQFRLSSPAQPRRAARRVRRGHARAPALADSRACGRVLFGRDGHRGGYGRGMQFFKYAEERKADLIVMGAQGHGPLERSIFGSKTREVVSGATCPVLTVRR